MTMPNHLPAPCSVAILADKDDLETMILGLRGVAAESGRRSHAEDLADGMEQLLREAFPLNADIRHGGTKP